MIAIKIKTGNAAFEDNKGSEVARILRDLATRFDRAANLSAADAGMANGRPTGAMDVNGNGVCIVSYTGEDAK